MTHFLLSPGGPAKMKKMSDLPPPLSRFLSRIWQKKELFRIID
jgi:hypothetical protein